jgi:hypothetical protein
MNADQPSDSKSTIQIMNIINAEMVCNALTISSADQKGNGLSAQYATRPHRPTLQEPD